jgi:surface protein
MIISTDTFSVGFKIFVILLVSKVAVAVPTDDFVITIRSNIIDVGSSSVTEFIIPTLGNGYDYNVDCNDDGALEATAVNGDYTCDYTLLGGPGLYTVRIQDNTGAGTGFPWIRFSNQGDRLKIMTIEQWGTGKWTSMASSFYGAQNLTIVATDKPDLSNVALLNNMFENAFLARPKLGTWDVTNILNMHAIFRGVQLPITDYDAILTGMIDQVLQDNVGFGGGNSVYCSADAQLAHNNLFSIYNWTVSDGGLCAPGADSDHFVITVKTDNLGSSTDTQFIIPVSTFGEVYNYSVDCNNDGTDEGYNLTGSFTCDYSGLGGAGTYTIRIKPLSINGFPRIYFNNTGDILKIVALEQWGTVIWGSAMNKAFMGTSYMQVNATDVPNFSNVINMNSMFYNSANANPDTINWNVSMVTDMNSLFKGASSLTPDTSSWNTSNVTNMSFMFEDAVAANPATSQWDTSKVTSMAGMFRGTINATPDTSSWNTSLVTNMLSMFEGAVLANPDTSSWDITQVTNMSNMFLGVTLPTEDYNAMLIGFAAQNVQSNVTFHGGNSTVCSNAAENAKNSLINSYGWQITDGGQCNDVVFNNGFETTVVVAAKDSSAKNIQDVISRLDDHPFLYSQELDKNGKLFREIFLRKKSQKIQIRISEQESQYWYYGKWINLD